MGTTTRSIAVQLATNGTPLCVEVDGRTFSVAAQPVRWFERRKWWTEEHRIERGRGAGVVDHEVWRLQVQLAPRAPLHTIDVRRHENSGRWELLRIHDRGQCRATA